MRATVIKKIQYLQKAHLFILHLKYWNISKTILLRFKYRSTILRFIAQINKTIFVIHWSDPITILKTFFES